MNMMLPLIRLITIAALSLVPAMQSLYPTEPELFNRISLHSTDVEYIQKMDTSEKYDIDVEEKDDVIDDKTNNKNKHRPNKKSSSFPKLATYLGLPVCAGVCVGGYFAAPWLKKHLIGKSAGDNAGDNNGEQNCNWLLTEGKKRCEEICSKKYNFPEFNVIHIYDIPVSRFCFDCFPDLSSSRLRKSIAIQRWAPYITDDKAGEIISYERENPTFAYKSPNANDPNANLEIEVSPQIYKSTCKNILEKRRGYVSGNYGLDGQISDYLAKIYAATLYAARLNNKDIVIMRMPNILIGVGSDGNQILFNNLKVGQDFMDFALDCKIFSEALNITKCIVFFVIDAANLNKDPSMIVHWSNEYKSRRLNLRKDGCEATCCNHRQESVVNFINESTY